MRHLKTVLSVLGAATVLVLAANTIALAATGQSLILGTSNSAGAITKLQRTTTGPALQIATRYSSSSPLVTNGTGKVTNLHADKLDGLDASRLQNAVWEYTLPSRSGNATPLPFSFPGLPAGRYLASYSVTAEVNNGGLLCAFLFNTNKESAYATGGVNNGYSSASGTGVVDSRTTAVVLRCLTPDGGPYTTLNPSHVTFIRIDTVTTGTATAPVP